jgi:hypothetical protein
LAANGHSTSSRDERLAKALSAQIDRLPGLGFHAEFGRQPAKDLRVALEQRIVLPQFEGNAVCG